MKKYLFFLLVCTLLFFGCDDIERSRVNNPESFEEVALSNKISHRGAGVYFFPFQGAEFVNQLVAFRKEFPEEKIGGTVEMYGGYLVTTNH